MAKYNLHISKLAAKHIDEIKKSGDKASYLKLATLLEELQEHPYDGAGRPEELKGNFAGYWSRRINQKDRLVYRVEEVVVTVTVVQA